MAHIRINRDGTFSEIEDGQETGRYERLGDCPEFQRFNEQVRINREFRELMAREFVHTEQ